MEGAAGAALAYRTRRSLVVCRAASRDTGHGFIHPPTTLGAIFNSGRLIGCEIYRIIFSELRRGGEEITGFSNSHTKCEEYFWKYAEYSADNGVELLGGVH